MTLDEFALLPRRALAVGNINTGAAVRGHVTPRIGGRYVLAGVTMFYVVTTPTKTGVQVYISDDDDLTDLTNLTGDRVFTGRLDPTGTDHADTPYHLLEGTIRWEPMLYVPRPSSFLKAKIHTSAGTQPYELIFDLALL